MGDGVIEVLSTAGDTQLGGEDFDHAIVDRVLEVFEEKNSISLRDDLMARQRIRDAAEKAKCDLSELQTAEINLPFIAQDSSGQAMHLSLVLQRDELEELVRALVERTREICQNALDNARLTIDDIDNVILVGGQTRMPLVQRTVAEFLG